MRELENDLYDCRYLYSSLERVSGTSISHSECKKVRKRDEAHFKKMVAKRRKRNKNKKTHYKG